MYRHFLLFLFLCVGFVSVAQNEWTEISRDIVPDTILVGVKSEYKKYDLNLCSQKEDEKGEMQFRIEIQKKNTVYHLVYTADAVLISKTKSKSYTFDGDDMKKKKKRGGGGSNDLMPPRMPNF